jgi:integrase
MAKTSNLLRRGAHYYVRVAVPRPWRRRLGRSEIVRTLGTGDLNAAIRLRDRAAAVIRDEIDRAARSADLRPGEPGWLLEAARQQRQTVASGLQDQDAAESGLDVATETHYSAGGGGSETALAYRVFAGASGLMLSEAITRHLGELEPHVTKAWYNAKERELRAFAKWLRRDIEVREITRQMAGQYVAEKINASGAAPVTRRNRISTLVSFGEALTDYGALEANPFSRLTRTVKESRRGDADSIKREYTPGELLAVFTGLRQRLPQGDALLPIVAIAAYSGMRLEEVCTLRIDNIGEYVMRTGSNGVKLKNRSSVRAVPIHPAIASLVKHMRESSTDGWLVPGLSASGADEKRSHSLSTRYRRWLDRLGLPKQVDAHSLRRSFHQRCEDAGLSGHTIDLLVGRKRKGLTFGLYSRGPDWQRLVDAMGKVTYGEEVDGLVRRL